MMIRIYNRVVCLKREMTDHPDPKKIGRFRYSSYRERMKSVRITQPHAVYAARNGKNDVRRSKRTFHNDSVKNNWTVDDGNN